MLKLESPLLKLILIYTVFTAGSVMATTFDFLYFNSNGVSIIDIAASLFFWCGAAILTILFYNKRTTDSRKLMVYGLGARALASILAIGLTPTKELWFVYMFLVGLSCFLFWVPLNIMYFGMSKGKEAQLGTIYFTMSSVLSMALPLAGGFLANNFGFHAIFAISALLYLLTAYMVFGIGKTKHRHDLTECYKELKGFKTLMLIEGVYSGGYYAIILAIPLLYFSKPVEMATFFSATALFSVIASFVSSRLSDKARKRKKYIALFGTGMSVVTALGWFASSASLWYVFISARNFFGALFWPFTTTILVDNNRDMVKSMVGREFILNFGRVIGIAIVIACAVYYNIFFSLAVIGLIMALYPIIIELKKHKMNVA